MNSILILLGIAAAGAAVWHVKGNAPWERRVDPGPPIPDREGIPIPIFVGDTADEYIAVLKEAQRAADARVAPLPIRAKLPFRDHRYHGDMVTGRDYDPGGRFAGPPGPPRICEEVPTVPDLAILPVDPVVAPLPVRAKRPWICGAAPKVPDPAILPVEPVVDAASRILPMPDPIAEAVAGVAAVPPPPPIVAASPPPIAELEPDLPPPPPVVAPRPMVPPVVATPAAPIGKSVIPPMSTEEKDIRARAALIRDRVNRLADAQWKKDDKEINAAIKAGGDAHTVISHMIFRILEAERAIGGVVMREQAIRSAQKINMRHMTVAELQRELVVNIRPSARRRAIGYSIKLAGLRLRGPASLKRTGYRIPPARIARRRAGDLTLEQAVGTRERLLQDRRLDNQRVRNAHTINALTTFIFRERGRRGLPREPNPMPFVRG